MDAASGLGPAAWSLKERTARDIMRAEGPEEVVDALVP
jgi:hypothetical protein